jgi:hypothetical protein
MILIAWDQKDCVHVTIGKHGAAGNLSTVINEVSFPHGEAREV